MHSDTFGYVRKLSEAFGRFRIFLDLFNIFALVPNTDEANDEMCGPTTAENLGNVLSQAVYLLCLLLLLL